MADCKRGPKPEWECCYICGIKLSRKQRGCFVGRDEKLKGYCPDCYKIYFSESYRIDQFGRLKCQDRNHEGERFLDPDCFAYCSSNIWKKNYQCRKCHYKRSRAYLKKNPEKRKEYRLRDELKHREVRLKSKRNRSELERETLDDNYIRRLLARYSDLAESEFTQEEIEAKRKWILKYREMGGFDWWKSEMKVRKTLERIFPGFKFPVRRPAWNLNPLTGNRIELDCYNKELRIAVEYNGKQHYEAIEDFQTEENLKAQQKRDIAKQLNCAAKGVRLIVVPYWIDDYENFLRDSLKSKK